MVLSTSPRPFPRIFAFFQKNNFEKEVPRRGVFIQKWRCFPKIHFFFTFFRFSIFDEKCGKRESIRGEELLGTPPGASRARQVLTCFLHFPNVAPKTGIRKRTRDLQKPHTQELVASAKGNLFGILSTKRGRIMFFVLWPLWASLF